MPLTGGIGRMWGTAVGAVTIGVLSNGLNILGVEACRHARTGAHAAVQRCVVPDRVSP